MAQKRLKVFWRPDFDYSEGDWLYGWQIVHGNETLCFGARTYTTKSNLFRGIRRAMDKMGIENYDIVEDK